MNYFLSTPAAGGGLTSIESFSPSHLHFSTFAHNFVSIPFGIMNPSLF